MLVMKRLLLEAISLEYIVAATTDGRILRLTNLDRQPLNTVLTQSLHKCTSRELLVNNLG